MRIGLLDQTTKGWYAGASFTRMLIACIELANDSNTEVIFLSRSEQTTPPSSFKSIFIGEQPDRAQWTESIKDADLDVILPVRDHTVFDVDLPFVGWIPDFQHLRLPELFDPGEIRFRDQIFSAIAQKASVILLSSESARMDFEQFFAEHAAKARVAHFPSLLWTVDLGETSETIQKYHLPQKFALVANQFWRHKNHRILPPALGLLMRRGLEMSLVVTGLPCDYRDSENRSLSQFFQEFAKEDVMGSLHFLGQIPYQDLVALMRAAALIIQPSFFEGWSTSIEDSKALGRPLVCSDIPVHREQVPDALGFFDPREPEKLADLLAEIFRELPPGPDFQKEEASIELARERASGYGWQLLQMTKETAAIRLREVASLLEKSTASAEQQRKYIGELEALKADLQSDISRINSDHKSELSRIDCDHKSELSRIDSDHKSELSRLRRWNHYLRRESLAKFVSRNILVRWRLVRKRLVHLRGKRRTSKP